MDYMPFIEGVQELSEGNGKYQIHRYRVKESSLWTQWYRIIKRVHLTPRQKRSEASRHQGQPIL